MLKKILAITMLCGMAMGTEAYAYQPKKKAATGGTKKNTQNLHGVWELSYIEGVDIQKVYSAKKPSISLDLKNRRINGYNGCQNFMGQLQLLGNKFSFVERVPNKMIDCVGNGSEVFMQKLKSAKSFAMTDTNKLDMIAGDIGVLQFTRKVKTTQKAKK